MGAEKDIIVAVELGSTSIRAIAGKREPDGTMKVLAIAQEKATNAIRKGLVDNIDKTSQGIQRVINKLNDKLNISINRVYVGLAGQSLHTVANKVPRKFEEKIQISNKLIDQLMDINHGTVYPDAQILETIPQEYQIGNRSISDPVGMQSDAIEGRYMNIIARNSLTENIEKCLRIAGLELAEIFISPICLADSLLSGSEKRSGCALIDMGADTTTVAVYTNNILRHLAVIPIGGSNVTTDIATKAIEQEEAEQLKLKYGTAYHEETEENKNKIALSYDRSITEGELQTICEARYEEIIANAWAHIKENADKLLSGITITGGASKVRNLTKAFTEYTHFDKQIHLAKGLPGNISIAGTAKEADTSNLYTLMALLLQGTQGCVGETPVDKGAEAIQETLNFGPEEPKSEPVPVQPEPETVQPAPEPKKEEKPKKPKGPGFGAKIKGFWHRLDDMLSEEEEDEDKNKDKN